MRGAGSCGSGGWFGLFDPNRFGFKLGSNSNPNRVRIQIRFGSKSGSVRIQIRFGSDSNPGRIGFKSGSDRIRSASGPVGNAVGGGIGWLFWKKPLTKFTPSGSNRLSFYTCFACLEHGGRRRWRRRRRRWQRLRHPGRCHRGCAAA